MYTLLVGIWSFTYVVQEFCGFPVSSLNRAAVQESSCASEDICFHPPLSAFMTIGGGRTADWPASFTVTSLSSSHLTHIHTSIHLSVARSALPSLVNKILKYLNSCTWSSNSFPTWSFLWLCHTGLHGGGLQCKQMTSRAFSYFFMNANHMKRVGVNLTGKDGPFPQIRAAPASLLPWCLLPLIPPHKHVKSALQPPTCFINTVLSLFPTLL